MTSPILRQAQDIAWRPKISPYYLPRLERLEARGYVFDLSGNGSEREITVRRGDREIGTVSGILADYVAGEAVAVAEE